MERVETMFDCKKQQCLAGQRFVISANSHPELLARKMLMCYQFLATRKFSPAHETSGISSRPNVTVFVMDVVLSVLLKSGSTFTFFLSHSSCHFPFSFNSNIHLLSAILCFMLKPLFLRPFIYLDLTLVQFSQFNLRVGWLIILLCVK